MLKGNYKVGSYTDITRLRLSKKQSEHSESRVRFRFSSQPSYDCTIFWLFNHLKSCVTASFVSANLKKLPSLQSCLKIMTSYLHWKIEREEARRKSDSTSRFHYFSILEDLS